MDQFVLFSTFFEGIRNQINDIKKSQRQQSLVKRIKLTRPKQPLSYKQKEELCRKISELPPEYLPGLLPIIQSSSVCLF